MPCGSSSCCSNSCSKKQQCCNSEDTKTPDAVSVESSDDGCGENCACCGFDRPEMNTETVVGAMKKLAGQAYLIYGEHTAWPKEANTMDDKLKEMVDTLRKHLPKNFPVVIAEGIPGEDKEGDVLFFPSGLRIPAGADFSKIEVDKSQSPAPIAHPDAVPVPANSRHIFVCAHNNRDKRCGRCGPELASYIEALEDPRTHVRKCSHIGGHKFAGNLIIYDMKVADTGDWYGYVTPTNLKQILAHSERRHFTSGVYQSHWRGRTGMSKADCIEYAATKKRQQRMKIVIGGAVVGAAVAAAVMTLKGKKLEIPELVKED
ncbi:conserved hypothetical protein [Perkinsus marinus ATCC 50983]|uniref:Sucrase/ferredoxin-like family protein n=1 Tax=Perkinsus marinus (strain ATCC 50983 / TXsc) TaxID=423536 RepID=C5LR06_PERM5|nr:conserved hypothetical protein [Perkinsus marinus ATCC 50983]EER00891.1 conserved hypothetical protein [Perkinsus marinus ATCC 50983]|eukprot:XP_002768173.1 conserved hypothetical protein [Perkinsus marinus ATCC 50983]